MRWSLVRLEKGSYLFSRSSQIYRFLRLIGFLGWWMRPSTLWFQLEDMFPLVVTPQGIEKVMIQLKDTPTKVYAIGAELFLSKVPLEVLQN